jgi:hypothetical protein
VEEQKRRAEADKLAAITALEQRSREFMREKEEKRRLEQRIANMQSQLLIGGSKLEDTPVFRRAPCLLLRDAHTSRPPNISLSGTGSVAGLIPSAHRKRICKCCRMLGASSLGSP